LEAVAILGGLRLLSRREWSEGFPGLLWYEPRWVTASYPLWGETGALPAFIVIAAGINLYFIRHQSAKIQVITTVILVGVLLATALGVKSIS